MKKPKPRDPVELRWPTKAARDAADKAIDALSTERAMSVYIDTWIEEYKRAGGICNDPK